jgi:hypothetical protein
MVGMGEEAFVGDEAQAKRGNQTPNSSQLSLI